MQFVPTRLGIGVFCKKNGNWEYMEGLDPLFTPSKSDKSCEHARIIIYMYIGNNFKLIIIYLHADYADKDSHRLNHVQHTNILLCNMHKTLISIYGITQESHRGFNI